ncbi:MAG: divergent polysaccharide deacetylase family protein, partial [Bacillota bacterium]|nr:divergent polysaccharide deacetylase family protein [Bacillota bacterium]
MQNGVLGPRRVGEPWLGAAALAVMGLGALLIWWGQGLWREERLPQRLPLAEGVGYRVYREGRLLVFDLDGAAAAVRAAVERALPPAAREEAPRLVVEERPLSSLGGRGESWYYKAMPKAVRWRRAAPRRVEVRGSRAALLAQWKSIAAAARRAGGEVLAVRSASPTGREAGAESGLRWAEVRLEVGLVASIRGEELRLPVEELILARPIPRGDPDFELAGARVALVIDDWGLPGRGAERLLALPIPLTMAVIPYQPASRAQAEAGAARGWEVLLHLPMEPKNSAWRLSRETIRVGMSEEEIRRLVRLGLLAVPQADGINNHMGSRATASPEVMRAVLEEVRRRRL